MFIFTLEYTTIIYTVSTAECSNCRIFKAMYRIQSCFHCSFVNTCDTGQQLIEHYTHTHTCMYVCMCVCMCILYTGCPRRNVPDFGRVFLMLKYTDITQNTYVQSWTVTEIMARENCGLLAGPRTVPVSWQPYPCPSLSVVSYYGNSAHDGNKLFIYFLLGDKAVQVSAWHSCHV